MEDELELEVEGSEEFEAAPMGDACNGCAQYCASTGSCILKPKP